MTKNNQIEMTTLYKRFGTAVDYNPTLHQFRTLVYGWAAQEKRRHRRVDTALIFRRGWMSKKDAVSLSEYAGYNLL